jgi:phosphate transport system substrate-binding protein
MTASARELQTRFRFRPGTSELDSRAYEDIGRIIGIASQPAYQGRKYVLIGFADSHGTALANCKLSEDRANIVKQELAAEGLEVVKVAGLCAEAPVASNETPQGREKNRRVEVWVK